MIGLSKKIPNKSIQSNKNGIQSDNVKGLASNFVDNRPTAIAQRKLINRMDSHRSEMQWPVIQKISKSESCLQGQFYLKGTALGARHLRPIERWVSKFHQEKYDEFKRINDDPKSNVDINKWLGDNFGESFATINNADMAFEDTLDRERTEDELFGGPLEPPTATLAYGEESVRGSLAELRKNPGMARRGSRSLATTPAREFPSDKDSEMVRAEFEKRGGETMTGVDVLKSTLDEDAPVPHNLTDLRFRYPRTNRGSKPSTSEVVSGYVDRVAETGKGEMSIPTPAMYGDKRSTRNKLYGSKNFETRMKEEGVAVKEVRPGPESHSELGDFGYKHRMTDKPEEREGGVTGKTMVLERGSGPTSMEEGDDVT